LPALLGLLLMAALAGCSSDSGGASDAVSSTPAESATTAGPPPEAIALAQMKAKKIHVRGAPDWIADDGKDVFVLTGIGSVSVIDPARAISTRRPRSVCASGSQPLMTEVDATTHRVSRVVTDATPDECGDVHIAFDSVWLSTNEGDVVYRVPL
jgi:hypothetical protein